MDLFEHYQEQPPALKKICEKWEEKQASEGLTYEDCEAFQKEVEAVGYTFDSYLDAEPFNLRKLDHEIHKDPFLGELYGDYDNNDINNN